MHCTWFESANFFFSLSLCMSSSQPNSFFPPIHIYTQPTWIESSLENTHSCSCDLFMVMGAGMTYITYFVNVQSKSKVLGHLTAQHVILIFRPLHWCPFCCRLIFTQNHVSIITVRSQNTFSTYNKELLAISMGHLIITTFRDEEYNSH